MPRTPEHVQWVRYNPGAALFTILGVSRIAEVAHRRLADYYWQTGEWATVPAGNAAALCRADPSEWPALLVELATLGWHVRRKRLCHSGVQQVRKEAVSFLRSVRTAGRRGARRRWDGQGARARKPEAKPSGPAGPSQSRAIAEPCLSPSPAQPCLADSPAIAQPCPSHSPAIALPSPGHSHPIATPMASTVQYKTDKTVHVKQNSTTLNAFNDERLTLIVSARKKSAQGEKEFLKEVEEAFALCSPKAASDELSNWGGWWRNRFREEGAKARRVLAELASMIREGRILTNPGAAAVDLWSRLP